MILRMLFEISPSLGLRKLRKIQQAIAAF